jgi:hypothetical protein
VTRTDRRPDPAASKIFNRGRRWLKPALLVAAYAVGGVFAHFVGPEHLADLTLLAYAVAEIGGAAFIVRYVRTDWRSHPWGRHVMAFMVCMEWLFTLTLSARVFGIWPGLREVGFLASGTLAWIVWWRYRLLTLGGRTGSTTHDNARTARHDRIGD